MFLTNALLGRDEDMPDKKEDKPGADKSSFADSGELFETLFREELEAIRTDKPKKVAPETDAKAKKVIKKKPVAPVQVDTPKRVAPKTDAEPRKVIEKKPVAPVQVDTPKRVAPKTDAGPRKVIKKKPVAPVQADTPKRVAPKTDAEPRKVIEKKPVAPVQADTPKEVKPEKDAKIRKIIEAKVLLGRRLGEASNKVKIGLLSVILVALGAAFINYFGIVDFGRLTGSSKPAKKESIQPHAGTKLAAKTDKKPTRVAIKPPQKTASLPPSDKAASQKRTLVVKKSPKSTTSQKSPLVLEESLTSSGSKEKPRIVRKPQQPSTPKETPTIPTKPSQPSSTQQKRIVAAEPLQPTTSKEKPTVPTKPPQPSSAQQKRIVAAEPLQPATSKEKTTIPTKPPQPTAFTEEPVTVKQPPKTASQRKPPVVAQPPKPTAHIQKIEGSAKEELFPEEKALSYPYSVYLGAYRTAERANKALLIYRKKGLSAYWVKVDLGDKGVWFRVFTGHFKDKGRAEEFIKKNQLAGAKAKNTKYSTLIGAYPRKEELSKKSLALSRLGYSPYVIDGGTGESLLYVGAFYTKVGAETQRADLASKGIQSRVVER